MDGFIADRSPDTVIPLRDTAYNHGKGPTACGRAMCPGELSVQYLRLCLEAGIAVSSPDHLPVARGFLEEEPGVFLLRRDRDRHPPGLSGTYAGFSLRDGDAVLVRGGRVYRRSQAAAPGQILEPAPEPGPTNGEGPQDVIPYPFIVGTEVGVSASWRTLASIVPFITDGYVNPVGKVFVVRRVSRPRDPEVQALYVPRPRSCRIADIGSVGDIHLQPLDFSRGPIKFRCPFDLSSGYAVSACGTWTASYEGPSAFDSIRAPFL